MHTPQSSKSRRLSAYDDSHHRRTNTSLLRGATALSLVSDVSNGVDASGDAGAASASTRPRQAPLPSLLEDEAGSSPNPRRSRLKTTSKSAHAQLDKAEKAATMAFELMRADNTENAVPRDAICLGQSLRAVSLNPKLSPSMRRKQLPGASAEQGSPRQGSPRLGSPRPSFGSPRLAAESSPRGCRLQISLSAPLPATGADDASEGSDGEEGGIVDTRARLDSTREKIQRLRERWVRHDSELYGTPSRSPAERGGLAVLPEGSGSPLQPRKICVVNEHGMTLPSRGARLPLTTAVAESNKAARLRRLSTEPAGHCGASSVTG